MRGNRKLDPGMKKNAEQGSKHRGRKGVVRREKGEMENGKYDHEKGRGTKEQPVVLMVVIGRRGEKS